MTTATAAAKPNHRRRRAIRTTCYSAKRVHLDRCRVTAQMSRVGLTPEYAASFARPQRRYQLLDQKHRPAFRLGRAEARTTPRRRESREAVFPCSCQARLKTRIREAAATPQLPRTPPSEMRRKTRLPERGTHPGRPTRPSAAQRLRRRSPTRFAKSQPRRRASPRQRGIARGAIPRQRRGTLCRQAKATVFPLWTRP